jgi:hypothetical protein
MQESAMGLDPAEVTRLIKPFWGDGRILRWPARDKARRMVLAEVAHVFPLGRRLPEAEVDRALRQIWPDHCQLRRALVDYEFLGRKDGHYWRVG